MKSPDVRFLVWLSLVVALPALSATATPSLSAAEIATRSAAARGGVEAWRKVSAISMSGTMDAGRARPVDPEKFRPGRGGPVGQAANPTPQSGTAVRLPYIAEYQRPRKSRLEIVFNGQTAVQVYDGQKGYKYRPFLNRTDWEPFSAEELRRSAEKADLDGPLLDYAAKGTRLVVEGTEPVDGSPAYKLKLTLKDGQVRHVWVDAASFLEVKIDGTRRMDGKPRAMYTIMRDYRSVNGLKIPYEYETTVDNVAGSEKIAVEKVTLNPALPGGRFVPPAAAAAVAKPAANAKPAPNARPK